MYCLVALNMSIYPKILSCVKKAAIRAYLKFTYSILTLPRMLGGLEHAVINFKNKELLHGTDLL